MNRTLAIPCTTCRVRDIAVCATLSPVELEALGSAVTQTSYGPDESIYFEGDNSDFLYIVLEGAVRLVKIWPDGERQVMGFRFLGESLGLNLNGPFDQSAEAISSTRLCRIPQDHLMRVAETHPTLDHKLLQLEAGFLKRCSDHLAALGRKSAMEKLALFLSNLSAMPNLQTDRAGGFRLPMSREDIGDYLGLTTETVSRCFTRLTDSGIITLKSPRIVAITQTEELADLAGLAA